MFVFVIRNLFLALICAFISAFSLSNANAESPRNIVESGTEKQEVFVDITWNTNDGSAGMHYLVKCINGTPAEVSEGISLEGSVSDLVKASVTPLLAPDGKNFSLYVVLSVKNAVIFDGICNTEDGKTVSIGNKDITFSIIPSLNSNRK